MTIAKNLAEIGSGLPQETTLIAVSKRHPIESIQQAYDAGHRHFGENLVQELCAKQPQLPSDIKWHAIGHLQTNKVKYIAPFVHLIHGVDSLKLLKEIDKRGRQNDRVISCLLQVKISEEETKFGLSATDVKELVEDEVLVSFNHVKILGLMGMASNTDDDQHIRTEFTRLMELFKEIKSQSTHSNVSMQHLSMGMSGDYSLAIECGSNMIRVGSAIFGSRPST